MRKLSPWALLLIVLVATACRSGEPVGVKVPPPDVPAAPAVPSTPPVAAAPAAPPAPVSGCLQTTPAGSWGWVIDFGRSDYVANGLCARAVHTRHIEIRFRLGVPVDQATLERHLTVKSAQPWFLTMKSPTWFELSLPPGQADEQIQVELAGPLGADGAQVRHAFHLTRQDGYGAEADLRVGNGPWQPLSHNETAVVAAAAPLTMRLRFGESSDIAAMREHLDFYYKGLEWKLDQPAPNEVSLSIPNPPKRLDLQGFSVFTGRSPELVSLDPATGKEEVLGPAPLDALWSSVSPDGRRAVVWATTPRNDVAAWVLNLATGKFQRTPFSYDLGESLGTAWTANRLALLGEMRVMLWDLAANRGETIVVPAIAWADPPSGGRYLAGYSVPLSSDKTAAASILIFDLERKSWKLLRDVTRLVMPGKERYPLLYSSWTADGKALIVEDAAGYTSVAGHWRIDAATGKVAPDPGPVSRSSAYGVPAAGPKGWSLLRGSQWGPVAVKAPDGTEREWGSGLAIGWRPDGRLLVIRWADEAHRLRPPAPP